MQTAAIVMAAGAGTRMKSKKPKVAHEVLGKPMVQWVLDAASDAGAERLVAVVGHEREQVIPLVEDRAEIVVQPERLGTANAVDVCRDVLADFDGSVLVLSGDCPLITPDTLRRLVSERERTGAAAVVLTMKLPDPTGYGRIVRDADGALERIVEQKDGTPEELAIDECNSGFYCFDAKRLFWALQNVGCDNAQGEFYLTDVIELCAKKGFGAIGVATNDPDECRGANSRAQLAEATKIAQRRINAQHMANGVSMMDPDQVWIEPGVEIARDVVLYPQVFLSGATKIGEDSVIGPNTRLADTVVGERSRVDETVAIEAVIDNDVDCGPRAYLRPGAHLCDGSKAGTHVEIKKSTVGKGSKVPHLSYIGDTTIGEGVNIGAGSITCNYDGKHKHPTTIGDRAFIGSDTMMVAPVSIGAGSIIGAASCITRDVEPDALALTRPEQVQIAGWAKKKREELGID